MSFSWEDYITLAEHLNMGNPSEAQMRSAISRAYYGAFCLCRNQKGLSADRRADIHHRIINLYKTSENKTECSIGNFLDGLRGQRNEADYNGFYSPILKSTTDEKIRNAKSIVKLLISLE
jgi:uncharacterized protein (UPF0332 family)